MKVCAECGDEIDTKDGENLCEVCEEAEGNGRKRRAYKKNRRMMDEAMRSCGLVRVVGAMGGVYWE